MNIVESHWQQEESRWEDGVFFGNDEFIPLVGSPEEGYVTGKRVSLALLLQSEPDGWTEVDALKGCSLQNGPVKVFGGATSCEGEGFIAVEDLTSQSLLWLLHLHNSEPFVQITTEGTTIYALSNEYPRRFEWIIPIDAPQLLTVKPKGN